METENYFNLTRYKRVLTIATTPSLNDFLQVLKITVAGITVLGLLSYLVYAIMFVLPGGI